MVSKSDEPVDPNAMKLVLLIESDRCRSKLERGGGSVERETERKGIDGVGTLPIVRYCAANCIHVQHRTK